MLEIVNIRKLVKRIVQRIEVSKSWAEVNLRQPKPSLNVST